MERFPTTMLRIGDWCVNPTSGQISRDGETARLEARTMRLLTCLADHAGEVVSIDDLLNQVWSGIAVSSDSVYQAVASLRRLLGDDPKQPTYIATVPRLGYRMVATVSPWVEEPAIPIAQANALTVNLVPSETANLHHAELPVTTPVQVQKSIAVLPFSDLTEGMKEGEFADGMTEELIDKLSKLPGLHVPSPTSTFYYRDKEMPVADIAKALGVMYVLDGSVRKSGTRVRVAARLVQANNGYVIWTETYDRPFHDLLMVQDDIAGEVTKALGAATEFKAS